MNSNAIRIFLNSLKEPLGDRTFDKGDLDFTNRSDEMLSDFFLSNGHIKMFDNSNPNEGFINELREWSMDYEREGFILGYVYALEQMTGYKIL